MTRKTHCSLRPTVPSTRNQRKRQERALADILDMPAHTIHDSWDVRRWDGATSAYSARSARKGTRLFRRPCGPVRPTRETRSRREKDQQESQGCNDEPFPKKSAPHIDDSLQSEVSREGSTPSRAQISKRTFPAE
jgi:hypothetical protein